MINMNINKTIIEKTSTNIKWYLFDAKKYKLGRLSTKIAYMLRNKNNANYLPYQETKINIIVINSKEIQITGKKSEQKIYKRHSGRPGGMKVEIFNKLQQRLPNRIIEVAIKGMLPKNSLGRKLFKKIKIYPNNIHPYESKKLIEINTN
uniref:Large ribosomal subunit protein uL13c n=1 Tax=Lophosiphonia teges TaxID=2007110 RepID=A0A1Z1MV74_9FLOR|nr:ribosomal protein L13 [Polysiphonia teges]